MEARPDRNRVQVFSLIRLLPQTFPVKQFAKSIERRRWLMVIYSRGKHIGDEIGITIVNQQRELQRAFPEAINKVLQHVDSFLAIQLVIGKGIGLIAPVAVEVGLNMRGRQLTLPQSHSHPE